MPPIPPRTSTFLVGDVGLGSRTVFICSSSISRPMKRPSSMSGASKRFKPRLYSNNYLVIDHLSDGSQHGLESKDARSNLSYQIWAMERLIRSEGASWWTYSSRRRHMIPVTPPSVGQSTEPLWRTRPPWWLHTCATSFLCASA